MSSVLSFNSFIPIQQFAPKFSEWLSQADRLSSKGNAAIDEDVMSYYAEKLTAGEAIFCGDYARHLILGTIAPDLNEGSLSCSPMYRQALLEKKVREKLKEDNYLLPLAIQI